MKKIIMLLAFVAVLVMGQSCTSKVEESANDTTVEENEGTEGEEAEAAVDVSKSDEIVAKREKIAKASAEKEVQRKLAIEEKAKASPTYKDATGKTVYYKAEISPTYVGGMKELRKYLSKNLKYPEEARQNGVEGTVFVDFVIDEKGQVREIVASDVVGEVVDVSFKEESVRVVAAMPAWEPGRQHGKAVDASYSIPITFEIGN